jgi:putative permease
MTSSSPADYIRTWVRRHFSDPQAVILAMLLVAGFAVVLVGGKILAPVLASLVIAYLLDGAVEFLERRRIPRMAAALLIFFLFITLLVLVAVVLLPLLSRQVSQLFELLPAMIGKGQALLMQLPEHYPQLFSEEQVLELIAGLRAELGAYGQRVVSLSVTSVVSLITLVVYLVLVPIMVFFFLKDKEHFIRWFRGYLPKDRQLATQVWHEMDLQLGNYIRGKFIEILIVWAVSYATFTVLALQFAVLLGALVGLSVIVPFVGATVVTFPVALVAYFQWGWSTEFAYVVIAYTIIQALDGNVLVPLLFSEVNNLHPVAIIVAVIFFGGIWGFWGVFFAIPLATLVKAVLNAWPRSGVESDAAPAT